MAGFIFLVIAILAISALFIIWPIPPMDIENHTKAKYCLRHSTNTEEIALLTSFKKISRHRFLNLEQERMLEEIFHLTQDNKLGL